jgi:NAD(P)-dependent dehydrogenase (short-subunit alcohol dehydrogenase family)
LEHTFAVNHLAHFLLVTRLLDLLKANAPSRVVVVSSMTHESGRVDLSDLQSQRSYDGMSAYAQSKRANVLFVQELAKRLEGTGVTANALHPGVIATKLLHEYFSGGAPVTDGAKTSVYLATSQEIGSVTGEYFRNRRPASSTALEGDGSTAEQLWRRSEELISEILGKE